MYTHIFLYKISVHGVTAYEMRDIFKPCAVLFVLVWMKDLALCGCMFGCSTPDCTYEDLEKCAGSQEYSGHMLTKSFASCNCTNIHPVARL